MNVFKSLGLLRSAALKDRNDQGIVAVCQRRMALNLLQFLVASSIFLFFSHPATASSGDAAASYQGCVIHCQNTGCAPFRTHPHKCRHARACQLVQALQVPWELKLMQWSCQDDCRYQCMAEAEHMLRMDGVPPQKYFGKWAFIRVLGMQEIASVLFSIANLAAHIHCMARLLRVAGKGSSRLKRTQGINGSSHQADVSSSQFKQGGSSNNSEAGSKAQGVSSAVGTGAAVSKRHAGNSSTRDAGDTASDAIPAVQRPGSSTKQYPYLWLWVAYGIFHVIAWGASAIFHMRDTWLTERIDYMAADSVVAMGLIAALVRTFSLGLKGTLLVTAAVGAGLLRHARFMLFVKFDYGWNVKVCIAAGVLSALLWLGWSLVSPSGRSHPGRRAVWLFLVLAHAALLLEVLDFPPLLSGLSWKGADEDPLSAMGLVDAHALWHAATVPLTYLFYSFILADAKSYIHGGSDK